MAIGASLVAKAEGARTEAELSGMETIDMIVVLMAIGAAVVARWTVKAVGSISGLSRELARMTLW